MLIIIFSWICLFVVTFLVGKLFLNPKLLLFLKLSDSLEWYEYCWVGFAIILAILQIWSIFLPINIYSLILIFGISLVSSLILFKNHIKPPKINVLYLLIIGVIFFGVSYFSSSSCGWPDTHGYHLNAVKWANSFPVVPGLANLHSRLGFNSSFFLFASMIDNVLKDRSSHIALSFMASALLAEYVWLLIKSKDKYLKVFLSLTLPVILGNVIKTGQISSLSYDFALLLMILAICIELIRNNKSSLLVAGILSIILLTIKLSGVSFSFFVICYVSYEFFTKYKERCHYLWVLLLFGLVTLAPYVIRNIILSGWPFYPIPILGFNLSWTVQVEKVETLFRVIKAWAILPGESYAKMIDVPIWKWLPGWVSRNVNSFELISFMFSLLTIVISFTFKFISLKTVKKHVGIFAVLVSSFFSILYLLLSAPDFRFGSVFFWTFFASIMSIFCVKLFDRTSMLQRLFFIAPLVLICYVAWPPRFGGEIMLKSIRWDQSLTNKVIEIRPKDGSHPFNTYVPDTNDSCGNSNLPCTPEYKNDIKEILPGDISKGFMPVR